MKRILCMFLCVAMILALCVPTIAAESKNLIIEKNIDLSKAGEAKRKVESMAKETGVIIPEIVRVKQLKDFSGNGYTLFECAPSGYLIYNNATGIFVEGSAETKSPYDGYSGELLYAGIMNYFCKNTDSEICVNIKTGNKIEATSELINHCDQLQNNLDTSCELGLSINERESDSVASTVTSSGTTFVDNYGYIRNLRTQTQMGYAYDYANEEGMCGWIASGIVILYIQCNSGAQVIPTTNAYVSNNKFTGNGFTWLLRGYGVDSDTIGSDLAGAILNYTDDYNFPLTATHRLIVSNNPFNYYINNDLPVVAGGRIWDCRGEWYEWVDHYIVIYGYNDSEYVCHYGWSGDNCIYFNRNQNVAVWGDMVNIELEY